MSKYIESYGTGLAVNQRHPTVRKRADKNELQNIVYVGEWVMRD